MLDYPFGQNEFPEAGSLMRVADGVFWLRMALPFSLDHINLWLLEDGDSWTIVDTGLDTQSSRAIWDQVISHHLKGNPVKRIIVTHLHPDHIGLAGWLTRRFECELWISQGEYNQCKELLLDDKPETIEEALQFYKAAGYNAEQLAAFKLEFGAIGNVISTLPESYHRLQEGDALSINGRAWQVVVGSGHSPEHACLYCPEQELLISGDQVLPRISSNISLYPTNPRANPLAEWLGSCDRLRNVLPDNLLVLPAHQEPFYGLHNRLAHLIKLHEKALDRLLSYLDEPRTAIDCIPAMFTNKISKGLLLFAIGETLAHLSYLVEQKKVARTRGADGRDYYARVPGA